MRDGLWLELDVARAPGAAVRTRAKKTTARPRNLVRDLLPLAVSARGIAMPGRTSSGDGDALQLGASCRRIGRYKFLTEKLRARTVKLEGRLGAPVGLNR